LQSVNVSDENMTRTCQFNFLVLASGVTTDPADPTMRGTANLGGPKLRH